VRCIKKGATGFVAYVKLFSFHSAAGEVSYVVTSWIMKNL